MGGVAGADFGTGVGDAVRRLDGLGASAELIPGTTAGSTRAVIHAVEIDCTANTAEDVYVRFYDHAAPTVGTTDADLVLPGFKGTTTTYNIIRHKTYADDHLDVWATAISAACVTEAGGGSGNTAPSGTVNVAMVITKATA